MDLIIPSSKFQAVPLFDSHGPFLAQDKNAPWPSDIPAIREFLEAVEPKVPGAQADYEQVRDFLWSKCRRSEATYNAFRSESERFLLWAWCVHGKSISVLRKRDIEAYIDFVVKPPKSWIGTAVVRRFETNEGQKRPRAEWRPFVVKIGKAERKELERKNPGSLVVIDKSTYSLSQKSIREVFSNLSVLYGHLVEEDYAFGNVISAVKKSSPHLIVDVTGEGVKRLSALEWEYVLETATARASEDLEWERHLFIVASMKSLYLRVSELSHREKWTPRMGDFVRDPDGNWWFTAFGKGNKKRKISVPDDYLGYLKRYRESRGLDGLPGANESAPLLQPARRQNPGLHARTISLIAQEAFDQASSMLEKDGFAQEAKTLRAASTHWLRHTGASMDVDTRALKDLAADLGHGKLSTTDKEYVHADDTERAASGKNRKV